MGEDQYVRSIWSPNVGQEKLLLLLMLSLLLLQLPRQVPLISGILLIKLQQSLSLLQYFTKEVTLCSKTSGFAHAIYPM